MARPLRERAPAAIAERMQRVCHGRPLDAAPPEQRRDAPPG
ncbi:hypothetical protein [Pseudorhodoferax sp. Leaf267]|nr:hypothetical protein [Pseudorhodoferax sp. Leaf267]